MHQLLQKFNLKTSIVSKTSVSKTSIASTLLYTNTTCFNTRLQTWRTETRWSQKACSLLPRSSVGSTEGDKSFFCWTFPARHRLFLFDVDLLQNVIGLLLALICTVTRSTSFAVAIGRAFTAIGSGRRPGGGDA